MKNVSVCSLQKLKTKHIILIVLIVFPPKKVPLIGCSVLTFSGKASICFPSLTTPTATPSNQSLTHPWRGSMTPPWLCACVWYSSAFHSHPGGVGVGGDWQIWGRLVREKLRDFSGGLITNEQRSNTSRSLYPSLLSSVTFFLVFFWRRGLDPKLCFLTRQKEWGFSLAQNRC